MKKHTIKTMKLSELTPAAYNPRTISKEALAGLQASLNRFGLVQPIVLLLSNGIIISKCTITDASIVFPVARN
jgi:ParB-like chromosome segregation protein Spo0J